MSTATKTKPTATATIEAPLHDAVAATAALRDAREEYARAEAALVLAVADEQEAARQAFVAGQEHTSSGDLVKAQQRHQAAGRRVAEVRADDEHRQAELVAAVQQVLDTGGGESLAAAIEPMVEAGQRRLDVALDEVDAARRQLGYSISLLQSVGTGNAKVFVPAALEQVDGLRAGNGAPMSWMAVEEGLRGLVVQARSSLDRVASWEPPWQPRVSHDEIVKWCIAAGMTYSDSVGEMRSAYLQRGPRAQDAYLDEQDRAAQRAKTQIWAGR